ncbi:hypothetical protein [Sphingomonas sp. PP-CC-1A-547]|uniref:hypothetical protein n=1 Tax=Sphingomonas sp. PP-CC-1A-547 TaxID=2135654 RepID=UPI0011C37FCB|nr:hypothetical protein [Sphingomonas sp. PP-CC-1A-547]
MASTLGGFGALLIAAAQTKPEDALSNGAGWAKLIGADQLVELLSRPYADRVMTGIGACLLIVTLVAWVSKRPAKQPAVIEAAPPPNTLLSTHDEIFKDPIDKIRQKRAARHVEEENEIARNWATREAAGNRLKDWSQRLANIEGSWERYTQAGLPAEYSERYWEIWRDDRVMGREVLPRITVDLSYDEYAHLVEGKPPLQRAGIKRTYQSYQTAKRSLEAGIAKTKSQLDHASEAIERGGILGLNRQSDITQSHSGSGNNIINRGGDV